MKNRLRFLKVCLAIAVGVIGLRLFTIQILEHDKWVALAEEQQTMIYKIPAKRGGIFMMDGTEPVQVVMNEPVWTVLVDPMVADEEKVSKVVDAAAGDLKVAEWKDVFADKSRRYYVVARNVKRAAAEKIRSEGLAGVWFQQGVRRVYAEGEMAATTLGFVNADGEGQYGVEGALDAELAGNDGVLKTVKDINNVPLTIGSDNVRVAAEDGKDIVLTIDRNIQYRAEKALKAGLERSGVGHGSVVVMDPRTGKILAMTSMPSYDPSAYDKVTDAEVFMNDAVLGAYEPASVCKTFAFAAAIDVGAMTPETTYYNSGTTTVDGWPIDNLHTGHLGTITMQTALEWSLNTGSTQALRLMGGSDTNITYQGKSRLFDYYYNRFGFGKETGVELYEAPGLIYSPDNVAGTDARYANMTFGQGMSITPLQVAAAFSAVVNGGEYYRPTIVEGEMVDGELVSKPLTEPVRTAITAESSAKMREMLHGVRGLWIGLDKDGYYMGGKTGTAQAVRDGAYVMDETVASYVGFGSANGDLPEYVIMVKIWEEGALPQGEGDAMPIFNEISNFMIDYLKIKPGATE